MKKLIVAKSAGFCFGVRRAVDMAYSALQEEGTPCYSIGQIIHNEAVVGELTAKGLQVAADVSEIPSGAKVILRAHGTPKQVYAALEDIGAVTIDAVCPKVRYIHQIVREETASGRQIVIIGESTHPEIQAIITQCENPIVFENGEELEKWILKSPENREKSLSVVFQTTQTAKNLELCMKILKKQCTKGKLFDTICDATSVRQDEAKNLSQQCDAMVVIGSSNSANSVHLAEICREHCKHVQFISKADDLSVHAFRGADTIGITAGASAPAWIIKEVIQRMSVNNTNSNNEKSTVAEEAMNANQTNVDQEKSFAELLEDSLKTIYNGETVTGIVAAVSPTEVSVDLGTKHSGYIPYSEFTDDPTAKLEDLVEVGATIEVSVVRVNDMEGTVMLSKRRLDAVKNWDEIEKAHEEETIMEGIVTETNKGGVVASVRGVRVFIPASQTGLSRDAAMTELLKKKVRLKITEVNPARRRVVGSIRVVAAQERRERAEKVWDEIEIGKQYDGVVKSLTAYGAFVDIGGIDGMVHVSELSWSRVRQPSEVVSVGDPITVYVIGFDKEARKISLGYKDPNANPWVMFQSQYQVGDVASAKIVKLMPFGAFAEVLPGVDGLIHISQIADRRIGKPDEVLSVGEAVDVKIIGIDEENHKISLSIRALSEPEEIPSEEGDSMVSTHDVPDALVYEVTDTGEVTGEVPEE